MFQYEARVIRVVDGDTVIFDVDLGFRFRVEVSIRLARVDAPERVNWSAQGLDDPARKFIEENCPPGSVVVLNSMKTEKWGRWLAEVYYQPGVEDRTEILRNPRVLNDELLRAGLVKPYDGGRK